ncbi:hypothetical protein MMC29_001300 [Sticta canariensis]|nr:hypothetical protein [Sticta canariensis]
MPTHRALLCDFVERLAPAQLWAIVPTPRALLCDFLEKLGHAHTHRALLCDFLERLGLPSYGQHTHTQGTSLRLSGEIGTRPHAQGTSLRLLGETGTAQLWATYPRIRTLLCDFLEKLEPAQLWVHTQGTSLRLRGETGTCPAMGNRAHAQGTSLRLPGETGTRPAMGTHAHRQGTSFSATSRGDWDPPTHTGYFCATFRKECDGPSDGQSCPRKGHFSATSRRNIRGMDTSLVRGHLALNRVLGRRTFTWGIRHLALLIPPAELHNLLGPAWLWAIMPMPTTQIHSSGMSEEVSAEWREVGQRASSPEPGARLVKGENVNLVTGQPPNAIFLFPVPVKLVKHFSPQWKHQLDEENAEVLYVTAHKDAIRLIIRWMPAGGVNSNRNGSIPYPKNDIHKLLSLTSSWPSSRSTPSRELT